MSFHKYENEDPEIFVYGTQAIQRREQRKRAKALDGSSSEKERKVNALALIAEEGRDNLRKAAVSWK